MSSNVSSAFVDIIKSNYNLNWKNYIFGAVVFSVLLFLTFKFNLQFYSLAIVIGLIYAYLLLYFPKIWLYSVLVLSGVFFNLSSEGLSIFDVLFAGLFIGSNALWLINKVLLKREKIAHNLGDFLILSFFFLLIFNFVVAFLNNNDLMLWLREYFMFSIVLIYFPIRDILKDEKDIKSFLKVFAVVVVFCGFYQIYLYYNRINTDLVYAYELKHGYNFNQTLYTIASIYGFVFTFFQLKKRDELLSIIFTGIVVVSLIATFSRTFWVTLAAVIFILFLFFPSKKKVKIVVYLSVILGIFFISAYLLMKDNLMIFLEVIINRFTSSAEGKQDLSVVARLMEWTEVIKQIFNQPLYGKGLGGKFSFYSVIVTHSLHTDIIHNGYLFILFRAGIPLSLFYFGFIVFYTIRAYDNLIFTKTGFLRPLAISNLTSILTMYVVNFTSSQFFYRDGIFITSFIVLMISLNSFLIKKQNK